MCTVMTNVLNVIYLQELSEMIIFWVKLLIIIITILL